LIDLRDALARLEGPFDPRVVARLNEYKVMVVRVEGEFTWHSHPETDDFFLVLDGRLTIQLRDGDVQLGPGQLYVVPAGVEHCPRSEDGADVLLIEPLGTVNTGDAGGALTKPERGL
jgi:mannose-6-phosphate isomerase-like protein (cupin superfamily)